MRLVGIITIVIALWILSIFMIMFGWHLFAVPVFGLKEITFLQAFGLTLIGGAFRTSANFKN